MQYRNWQLPQYTQLNGQFVTLKPLVPERDVDAHTAEQVQEALRMNGFTSIKIFPGLNEESGLVCILAKRAEM
ncbi:hypothetical protein H6G36_30200 [Anabaena minutissima FACHB-250]|nr:hypothetical protein [Anabaena minutissima FACHB-250]